MSVVIAFKDAVIVEAFRSKKTEKTYAEIRCDGSRFTVQSREVDLTELPQLEKVNLQISVVGRIYDGERGPNQVIYVEEVKIV